MSCPARFIPTWDRRKFAYSWAKHVPKYCRLQSLVCLTQLGIVERQTESHIYPCTFIWDLLNAMCEMRPQKPVFVVFDVEWPRWVNFISKSFNILLVWQTAEPLTAHSPLQRSLTSGWKKRSIKNWFHLRRWDRWNREAAARTWPSFRQFPLPGHWQLESALPRKCKSSLNSGELLQKYYFQIYCIIR